MKRILFILPLLLTVFLASNQLFASTNVGATLSSDTQWDQSGSPYIIQARVLVPPGVTLKIGPGVQVVFQGPATLQISGDLKVEGSAAAPAFFNMNDSGMQSALFIDGGEAWMANMKVSGGVFLAQDATIRMDGSEVTKGSGLYLKGTTVAHLKNNKFYGNATGVVLDGPIEATMEFNTLVQNTYGLYLKDFSKLVFTNNSVHDNESEVVNNATKAKLGGNYWGTLSPKSVKDKLKGNTVSLSPMKDLKDILRAYLREELPVITKGMSNQAEAEDIRADKAARAALKAFREKQSQADVIAMEAKMKTMTPPATPTPIPAAPTATFTAVVVPTVAPMPELAAPPMAPATPPTSAPTAPAMVPTLPEVAPPAASPAAPAATVTSTAVSALPEASPITNGLPAPPSLPSSIPEPPALGDMVPPPAAPGAPAAANPNPETASTVVSLPTSMPAVVPSPTPTPGGLGGPPVSSDDLASIVATAQAASTASAATTVESPTATVQIVPSAVALPDNGSNNIPAPPMPSDISNTLTSNGSAPTVESTNIPSAVPTAMISLSTDTPTSAPTSTPTVVSTGSEGSLVPTVGAPAPAAPKDSVPPPPDFSDSSNAGVQPPMVPVAGVSAPPVAPAAAPAAPTDNSIPSLPSAPVAAPAQPTAATVSDVPPAPPAPPAASTDNSIPALPPAPETAPAQSSASSPSVSPAPADNSIPSLPPPPQAAPVAPSGPVMPSGPAPAQGPASSSAPVQSAQPQSAAPVAPAPPADLDVDGMQAPPMDSGLDYANPKK